MSIVQWKEAREDFSGVGYRVRYCGERVLVTRHGKPWVVIARPTIEDIKMLEEFVEAKAPQSANGARGDVHL